MGKGRVSRKRKRRSFTKRKYRVSRSRNRRYSGGGSKAWKTLRRSLFKKNKVGVDFNNPDRIRKLMQDWEDEQEYKKQEEREKQQRLKELQDNAYDRATYW